VGGVEPFEGEFVVGALDVSGRGIFRNPQNFVGRFAERELNKHGCSDIQTTCWLPRHKAPKRKSKLSRGTGRIGGCVTGAWY
jgi:hypothetical protein